MDVAIDAELNPLFSVVMWPKHGSLGGSPSVPWHSVLALVQSTTHVATQDCAPIYREGWEDHLVHVPTLFELLEVEAFDNPLFNLF